ncbi:uncharacterized protein PHACADRAFT_264123 [Phanerochaete carnosa HHB-10118-sp]|uniref:Uncharacterized protein n=1 Tax=Phanerochaete carnosa (strain HHB-10118-sp) TaxID=650164 RepID=K5VV63_PHACS|nr:uncharacterized protein PHACADRAFT_264123 [Phanerochaete carnosa HHB-10118-sp]EKM50700.1 hypothetical protein PHACADRAFT_264123 [Phanerochaete carnosa HHB-10118-sp]
MASKSSRPPPEYVLKIGPYHLEELERRGVSRTEICIRLFIPTFFVWAIVQRWAVLGILPKIILAALLAPYYLIAIPTCLLAVIFPDCPYRTTEAAILHDLFHLLVDLLAPYSPLFSSLQKSVLTWSARMKEIEGDGSLVVPVLREVARISTKEELVTEIRNAARTIRPVHAIVLLHNLVIDYSGLPDDFAAFPWTTKKSTVDIQPRLSALSPLVAQTLVRMGLDIVRNELKSDAPESALPWPWDAPAAVALRCAKTLLQAAKLDSTTREALRVEMRAIVATCWIRDSGDADLL